MRGKNTEKLENLLSLHFLIFLNKKDEEIVEKHLHILKMERNSYKSCVEINIDSVLLPIFIYTFST